MAVSISTRKLPPLVLDPSIFRLGPSDVLALCVVCLLLLGAVMVQSAAMNVTGAIGWGWTDRGTRHVLFAAAALLTFFITSNIDYSIINRRYRPGLVALCRQPILWFLAISCLMCLAVLIPHVGISVNGARRWLPLGICQVQPSELAKWAVVLYLSWFLTHRPLNISDFWHGLIPMSLPVAAICLLIVIQDFGTAALIALCAITLMLIGGIRLKHIAIVLPPVLAIACWFIAHKEYRMRRMTAFWDPYAAPQAEGYHMIQSLLSFATGGLSGRGLGNGLQKLGYLPEDTTDFIFTVICEELGLFGALLVVALYTGIIVVAWKSAAERRDSFGRLLATGTGLMIGMQAAINIAVATVSVPPKGLSLPLVSAGGSGLVITGGALGLLRSITRHWHDDQPQSAIDEDDDDQGPAHLNDEMQISTSLLSTSQLWKSALPEDDS
jgi:cell division protein FtsW